MEAIGKLNMLPADYNVEWVISNFLSLSVENDKYYDSHTFSFNGASWYLRIYPNGDSEENSVGYVDLILKKKSVPEIRQSFSLSLKNSNGKKEMESDDTQTFKQQNIGHGWSRFISRAELLKRKSELLPTNTLTIVCTLEFPGSIVNGKCSSCGENVDADYISHHEKNRPDRPVKCSESSEVVLLDNENAGSEDETSLCEDFKEMLLNGINHDLTLKLGDKELRAHQDVLRSRSQVFKSMLSHNMKEKNCGVIDIPDCDPQAMEQFLCYIYSGKIDSLNEVNMIKLYYIADKYDMKRLKEKCCAFIKKSLSYTNICEVIQLALNHTDSGLLEHATEYFKDNMLEIMATVEWQHFLKDNSTVANELMMKSVQKLKKAST